MRPIERQVVVITGASSGMGLLTAREMARRGARVVMAARNARDLAQAAAEIRRDGGDAVAVPTDVTDADQVHRLARSAVEAFGRIDTWIGAAAVSAYATFREQPAEDFEQVLRVNFLGQVNGARAALPYLEQSGGALVFIGSALSDRGIPLQGAYCASKHALKGWVDSLRVELMKEGSPVRVTLVKPSSIDTPLFDKAKTQMGVQPRPIPPVYEPELAAAALIRAAEESPRDVYVGGSGKLLAVVERISPKLLDLHQLYAGFNGQRTDWPKSQSAPNNLYAPVADDGGVRGDFTAESHRRSAYQSLASHPVAGPLLAAGALAVAARMMGPPRDTARRLATLGAATLAGKALMAATFEA